MTTPAQVWESFAVKARPRRTVNAAGATTWLNWTQYADHGPNESVLGSVRDKRIVELGSGAGANLAHLATLGASRCTGVDVAPTRTTAAIQRWGTLPNIEFVTADAVAPGSVLAFSHLPPDDTPEPTDRLVTKHHLSIQQWRRALHLAGFDSITGEIIPAPVIDEPGTLLIRAAPRA